MYISEWSRIYKTGMLKYKWSRIGQSSEHDSNQFIKSIGHWLEWLHKIKHNDSVVEWKNFKKCLVSQVQSWSTWSRQSLLLLTITWRLETTWWCEITPHTSHFLCVDVDPLLVLGLKFHLGSGFWRDLMGSFVCFLTHVLWNSS